MTSPNKLLLITPSLLNSWLWIWESDNYESAYNGLISSLKRESTPPNEYMLEGIRFEKECYEGHTCVSPIIENGAFQVVGKKQVEVDGLRFLMYGRLDVLKAGKIYDIKRVVRYERPKYKWSCQHEFYLELFENVDEFEYLIYDGNSLHRETYFKGQSTDIPTLIGQFIKWLKKENLYDLYLENWRSKY